MSVVPQLLVYLHRWLFCIPGFRPSYLISGSIVKALIHDSPWEIKVELHRFPRAGFGNYWTSGEIRALVLGGPGLSLEGATYHWQIIRNLWPLMSKRQVTFPCQVVVKMKSDTVRHCLTMG
jgi:hypothetical protein